MLVKVITVLKKNRLNLSIPTALAIFKSWLKISLSGSFIPQSLQRNKHVRLHIFNSWKVHVGRSTLLLETRGQGGPRSRLGYSKQTWRQT